MVAISHIVAQMRFIPTVLAGPMSSTQWTFDKSPNLPASGGGGGRGGARHSTCSEGWPA